MPRQRYRLTPALQQQICAFVRSGAYARVAAEAAGVPLAVFEGWLRLGQEEKAREPYRSFAAAVEQALAQARLRAEVNVYKGQPRDWLRYGPGKEMADDPGWSTAPRPRSAQDAEPANPLLQPEVLSLIHALLEALTAYPEARATVAAAVAGLGVPSQSAEGRSPG